MGKTFVPGTGWVQLKPGHEWHDGAVRRIPGFDWYAHDTADLDRSRVHLANCIMNCGTRIYEGDKHHVTPDDEFYCDECAAYEMRVAS